MAFDLPNLCQQLIKKTTARVRDWCELIKVEHTIFALPFALSGLILSNTHLPGLACLFWTILAFTGARSAAMGLNRVIDAGIDSRNPRTKERAIPQGKIKKSNALIFSLLSFAIMSGAATQLPPLCLQLSPIAVLCLSLYSFCKRFTWLCHSF